jgi:hypothetical protein
MRGGAFVRKAVKNTGARTGARHELCTWGEPTRPRMCWCGWPKPKAAHPVR